MMFPSVLTEQRPAGAAVGQQHPAMTMASVAARPQDRALPLAPVLMAEQDQQGASEVHAQPSAIPQHNALNNTSDQQQQIPHGVSVAAAPTVPYRSEMMPSQQQQFPPQQFAWPNSNNNNMHFFPTPTAPPSTAFIPNPFVMSSAFQAVSSALPAQAFTHNGLNRTSSMDAKSSPSHAPQPAPHQPDYFALAAANLMMAAAAAAANGNPGPAQMLMPSAAFGQLGLGGAFGLPGQTPTGLSALINATGNPLVASSSSNQSRKQSQKTTKAKKRKQQQKKKRRRQRDEEQDDEEDTYATSSSVSESDDDDNDADEVDAARKSSKSKRHHRRRSTDEAEDASSSSSNSNKQASPPTRYMAERPRRSQSGGSNPSSQGNTSGTGAGAELDPAGEEAMFAEYNGEQRLTIDFDDLGTVTVPPERLGKKGLIPDDLAGSFMMYSERWFFAIKFVEDKTTTTTTTDSSANTRKLPNVFMHRCIEWKVKNEAWEDFHCIVETQEDALRRNTRGVTLCNKVFTEAMEMRAQEFQRLLVEEKSKPEPDQFQISFFESRMAAFRPKRFSEGPLLFGLRHKIVQRRAYIMTEEEEVATN